MSWPKMLVLLLAGLIGVWLVVVNSKAAPPNVLVVVVDTLRRDHLGCYGYERDTSPNIDAFAEEATLFERAYAQSSSTKPSMASLFVSRYPVQHRVVMNWAVLPESYVTLAEVLKTRRYATAGFVENSVVSKGYGYDQGFDLWVADSRQHSSEKNWGEDERRLLAANADTFDEEVFAWMESHRSEPFFLYVHYIAPHSPYHAPPAYRGRYSDEPGPVGERIKVGGHTREEVATLIDKYDEEVRYADDRFGSLLGRLNQLGLEDRTVVVFVSDHGEGFMEHGFVHHSNGVFSELIDIPLIVRAPGVSPPGRIRRPVQHVDLFPTLLELVGVDSGPYAPEGRSILPGRSDAGPEAEAALIFSEQLRRGKGLEQRAIIVDGWKLVRDTTNHRFYLYDLGKDPTETVDLSASEPARFQEMKQRMGEHLGQLEPGPAPTELNLSPGARESLESLGYL